MILLLSANRGRKFSLSLSYGMDAKLNQRLGRMSTEELVNIVSVDAHSYTPDARRMAGEILADRGVDVSGVTNPLKKELVTSLRS